MSKEQIYAEQIHPLLKQIVEICSKSGIAMIASFHTPSDVDDDIHSTAIIRNEDGNSPAAHVVAYSILRGDGPQIQDFLSDEAVS